MSAEGLLVDEDVGEGRGLCRMRLAYAVRHCDDKEE